MTTHSMSILSELKMSSFGPYAVAKTRLHQLRYQQHSVEGRAKCLTVPQCNKLVIGTVLLAKAVIKYIQ